MCVYFIHSTRNRRHRRRRHPRRDTGEICFEHRKRRLTDTYYPVHSRFPVTISPRRYYTYIITYIIHTTLR